MSTTARLRAAAPAALAATLLLTAGAGAQSAAEAAHRPGAWGFPQAQATILYQDPGLRVSAWSNDEVLIVQALVYADRSNALGKSRDGRDLGDHACLIVDVDANHQLSGGDRFYWLDPWPSRPGLRYQVTDTNRHQSHIRGDSSGRGSVTYVKGLEPEMPTALPVRVDTFVLSLAEIGTGPGQRVQLMYWGRSPQEGLTFNSVGYESDKYYYAHHVPHDLFTEFVLAEGHADFDRMQVPDGRDGAPPPEAKSPPLEVGEIAPELTAEGWINTEPLTLAALRGTPVLIEFFSTKCATCMAAIPALNTIHDEYGPRGLTVVAFTVQSGEPIDYVVRREEIRYAVGTGSGLREEYNPPQTPYAFLIAPDGTIAWHGSPTSAKLHYALDEQVGN